MLRQDDWLKSQLVTFGWRHGKKYGGHLASCIVMSVIMNRVKVGWGSLADIIHRFPETAANPEPIVEVPQIWEPNFVRLLHECESIFDGSQDYSKGALYFCDTAAPISEWFQTRILNEKDMHPCVGDMNSFRFYR